MAYMKILCQTNINDTIVSMNPNFTQNNLPEKKVKDNFFKEIIKFTVIALIIVVPIRTYVAQPFIVSGPSMDPTFATGQYIIVDQLSYTFGEPKRNDVVIFRYPRDPKTFYIKRIIGLPGETLVVDTGKVKITNKDNPRGFILDDSYVSKTHKTSETFNITLGATEYFVMGDNRSESADSRSWGPLDMKFIVGKPFVRLLPFNKISVFPGEIAEQNK